MSEDGSGTQSGAQPPPERGGAARLGRRIATVIFWCGALYMAVVGFYSIPLQVFDPEAAAAAPADDCEAGLRALRSELLSRAAEHVAGEGRTDESVLRAWLADWDLRHAALAPLCDGDDAQAAHRTVGRMRYRVEDAMRRFSRDQAPLSRELDRTLSRIPSREASRH